MSQQLLLPKRSVRLDVGFCYSRLNPWEFLELFSAFPVSLKLNFSEFYAAWFETDETMFKVVARKGFVPVSLSCLKVLPECVFYSGAFSLRCPPC